MSTESTFPAWYVLAWARQGIFPPPLHGQPGSPASVQFAQAVNEPALEPIDLTLSDEESIARQEAHCRKVLDGLADRVTPIPGTSSLIVGPRP